MNLVKTLSISYYIGMALLFIGIVMQLNDMNQGVYLMTVGVIPLLAARLYNVLYGKEENKRLNTILLVSSIVLTLSVASIFLHYGFWVVGIFITAMLDLYVSFRKFR